MVVMQAKEQCLAEQQDYEQQIHDLTFFLRTQVGSSNTGHAGSTWPWGL
jgi:hypothetical protein